jgi:hypothetical protein
MKIRFTQLSERIRQLEKNHDELDGKDIWYKKEEISGMNSGLTNFEGPVTSDLRPEIPF